MKPETRGTVVTAGTIDASTNTLIVVRFVSAYTKSAVLIHQCFGELSPGRTEFELIGSDCYWI